MTLTCEHESKTLSHELPPYWDFGNRLNRIGKDLERLGVSEFALSHLHLTPSLREVDPGKWELTWESAREELHDLVTGYASELGVEPCGGWVTSWTGARGKEAVKANLMVLRFCQQNPLYRPVFFYSETESHLALEQTNFSLSDFAGIKVHDGQSSVFSRKSFPSRLGYWYYFEKFAELAKQTRNRVAFMHLEPYFLLTTDRCLKLKKAAQDNPDVKFVLTHCACLRNLSDCRESEAFFVDSPSGGFKSYGFETIRRLFADLPNIFFDLSWEMDEDTIRGLLYQSVGSEKLVWSLDAPSTTGLGQWNGGEEFILDPAMRRLAEHDPFLTPFCTTALRNEKTIGRALDMPTVPWHIVREISCQSSVKPPLLAMPEAIIKALDGLVRDGWFSPEEAKEAARDIFYRNFLQLFEE